jgi:hypothetical protein
MHRVILTTVLLKKWTGMYGFMPLHIIVDKVCGYEIGGGIFASHFYEVAQVKNG